MYAQEKITISNMIEQAPAKYVKISAGRWLVKTNSSNHASLHCTRGMRCSYLAIPFALWVFGPTWMLMGTTFLVLVLYRLDRTV